MASEQNYCFSNTYEEVLASSLQSTTNDESAIIFNLSILKDKAQHVHSIADILFNQPAAQPQPVAVSDTTSSVYNLQNVSSLLQEIIGIASNVMFTCQNIGPGSGPVHQTNTNNNSNNHENSTLGDFDHLGNHSNTMSFDWLGGSSGFASVSCNTRNEDSSGVEERQVVERDIDKGRRPISSSLGRERSMSPTNYDIIEMNAADLLAKYTHYCQVCGKGFKRDANLRMHMRAHGDEYKSTAALANPISLINSSSGTASSSSKLERKFSCPQEGCRWNRKHVKFQPLKSMICMKNHYKRSHCPKMYACKRCHQKQFSVLSDLRTHEKHCGDVKWRCSCGTTFSRKDKLMGHVGLFVGHTPLLVDMMIKKQ